MADGSFHFGADSYDAPREKVVADTKRPKVPYFGQPEAVDVSKPFPVRVVTDPAITNKSSVDLINECFDAVYGKYKKGHTITINRGAMITLYRQKLKKPDQFRRVQNFPVLANRRSKNSGDFVNGEPKISEFTTTIRISPDSINAFAQYMDEGNVVYVSLKKKKISIFSGAGFKSPVEDINLGWKFAYISAAISIPLTAISMVAGMLAEAYDVPHRLRHQFELCCIFIHSIMPHVH